MSRSILRIALASVAMAAASTEAGAGIAFRFGFGEVPGASQDALVGSGSASFAVDPGDGTFMLASLGPFAMSFAFDDGATFTDADIVTPLGDVLVLITTMASARRLQFSNVNEFGDGPNGGSLDFEDAGGSVLSFAPPGTDPALELYFESSHFGIYRATAVPGPSSLLLLASAAPLGAWIARRYRGGLHGRGDDAGSGKLRPGIPAKDEADR